MPRRSLHVACHEAALSRAGLTSIEAIKAVSGDFVKNHGGVRDVVRLTLTDDAGQPITLFLKRNLIPIRKHGWQGLFRHGRFISTAEKEWRNYARIAAAGANTCRPVAWGAEMGPLGELFSFVLTEAAPGVELEQFVRQYDDRATRRRVISVVAKTLARLHDAGIGLPTIFARHIYLDLRPTGEIAMTLIDLDRIARPLVMRRRRARDLAQFHLSIPRNLANRPERMRFLRVYAGRGDRALLRRVETMARYLMKRKPNLAATYRGEPPVE